MPVTLALDTATPFLTLALSWDQGELEWSKEVGRAHAELLPGAVKDIFEQANLPLKAQRIVIGTGPGSYTGVRVGASYALGLGRVWNAPVLGVSTLEALVTGNGVQAVAMDARKGHVYAAIYQVSQGTVSGVRLAPTKLGLSDFQVHADGLDIRCDNPPSGLALLKAGCDHGDTRWSLAYL